MEKNMENQTKTWILWWFIGVAGFPTLRASFFGALENQNYIGVFLSLETTISLHSLYGSDSRSSAGNS